MITIDKLADKAKKDDWKLTGEEAIHIFQLLPTTCERYNTTVFIGVDSMKIVEILKVKGLGEFEIK